MNVSGGMSTGESMMDRLQGGSRSAGGGGGGGGGGRSRRWSMGTDDLNNMYGPPGGY